MCGILYCEYPASAIRNSVNAHLRIEILRSFPMRLLRYCKQSHAAAVVRTLRRVALHSSGIVSENTFLRMHIRRRRIVCPAGMQLACQSENACIQADAGEERRFFDGLLRTIFYVSRSLRSAQYPNSVV
jgi:hypothetical protein